MKKKDFKKKFEDDFDIQVKSNRKKQFYKDACRNWKYELEEDYDWV